MFKESIIIDTFKESRVIVSDPVVNTESNWNQVQSPSLLPNNQIGIIVPNSDGSSYFKKQHSMN